ncbi:transcriptional activator RfaH [Blastochloris sulfoviridis]|uniref:Transcriptional activator RfaH n=1 Tax=Blastochloris sulfoviridis TaxID=50712 RepID=A0A5M6I421_9HYPH|nr:transcriptional activator RfaH [Blastochloris sulfoviridis]
MEALERSDCATAVTAGFAAGNLTGPTTDNVPLGARWYVGHTLPRKEVLARTNLLQQGFAAYLPRVLTTRRHARRFEVVKTALFPRYIFIRLDLARDRWRSVNGTIGISHIVSSGDLPCPVPAGIVEELSRLTGDDDIVHFEPELAPGDRVRLTGGPFTGGLGVLERLDARGRVEILLELLNGTVRLKVARELIEPIR